MVVVRLVVLVPVVSRLDAVEITWLSGPELVVPPVRLHTWEVFKQKCKQEEPITTNQSITLG